jgi:hypothetical protein
MRKHQQRQILELLRTISDAQVVGLYADCQEGALEIGNAIESVEGEGTQTVALLEEYFELLFKASNGEISEKALRKQMTKIENSVKTELKPNRVEMVFLTYKASMSDCLESIYLAAKADSNCDAYWIPIPYYDRNPDGTPGAMHFEGPECYGGGIDCTDWKKYNIEERHPDVIFTFNPYDSYNLVTTVHPNYYCERLRNLTEMLVYVPYFVCVDDVEEPFCTVVGCVYAHKVIVQSEKVRETYSRVFKGKYGNKFGRPEDKFVALGSPKLDKVLGAKREDYTLPDEWRGIIRDRKVVFYNTGISAMLSGDEWYLEKLSNALDFFRNRDDVALWWRPHPLVGTMYASMRPQLIGEYERIVADYKKEGWGIYDDTPNLHRAIAWSDAYYGDASSLVQMFKVAGKPVLLGEHRLHANAIMANNATIVNDTAYLATVYDNVFVSIDLKTGEVMPIDCFESKEKTKQYHATLYAGERIYFSPYNSKEIAVFNKVSHSFSFIPLETHISNVPGPYFSGIVQYNRKLFFIPLNFPGILELDIDTSEYVIHSGWKEKIESLTYKRTNDALRGHPYVVDNRLLMSCRNANAILDFNMENGSWKILCIGNEKVSYTSILHENRSYWLLGADKDVLVKWDEVGSQVIALPCVPEAEGPSYFWLLNDNKYIWLIPYTADRVLKIDKESLEVIQVDILREYLADAESHKYRFACATMYRDYIFLIPYKRNSVFFINTEDDSVTELKLTLDKDAPLAVIKEYISSKELLSESALISLDKFIELCLSDYTNIFQKANLIKECGTSVYNYCCNLSGV